MLRHATIALACVVLPALGWAYEPGQSKESKLIAAQPALQQAPGHDAIPFNAEKIRNLMQRVIGEDIEMPIQRPDDDGVETNQAQPAQGPDAPL